MRGQEIFTGKKAPLLKTLAVGWRPKDTRIFTDALRWLLVALTVMLIFFGLFKSEVEYWELGLEVEIHSEGR